MSLVLDRYGIAGHIPSWRAALRFDFKIVALVTERGARRTSTPFHNGLTTSEFGLPFGLGKTNMARAALDDRLKGPARQKPKNDLPSFSRRLSSS